MEEQIWRDIPGFVNYQVSSFGFVRNCKTSRMLKIHARGGGYVFCTLMNRGEGVSTPFQLSVHRLVAQVFIPNADPTTNTWVDHINHNRSDNRAANLQWVTPKQNAQKRGIMCNNTSGITGVYFNKPTGKWMAYIREDSKMTYLGVYATKAEAEFMRVSAASSMFGEFATANNVTASRPTVAEGPGVTITFD